ncbi:MAG TPA: glycine betaine ABC transporter substrate-binding protein [Candidatus Baltobacteraceae bacterium]|nr:glycine betaine ABC transporter substrate-binding protein [Candidatus Baltobacteraceae bacterium]
MPTRKESLALIAAALALPQCSGGSGRGPASAVRVGSKNFTEDITIAEIYAAALENAKIPVERHMNLGSTQIAMAALQRGDIDLYPEYTGTALIDVLHMPPMRTRPQIYGTVKQAFEKRFNLTLLTPSPMNDSQGLCVSQAVAQKYNLRTLSQCAKLAPQLRLATIAEFLTRADALPGLQQFYGGFHFSSARTYEIGLQYEALLRGDADVATAFTTDSQIGTDNLLVLQDDRHFWPEYNVAPVARMSSLKTHPQIAAVLNRVSPLLTDSVVRQLNYQVNVQHTDPADAAQQFLKEHAV